MILPFYKYQGTGNDFIIIDNRKLPIKKLEKETIEKWCDRRFGIGSDGVILIQEKEGKNFEMIYYNSDGSQSLCGNGSRCAVAFAKELGIVDDKISFEAYDGVHDALLKRDSISIKMNDVKNIEINNDFYFVNTGSPHYVKFVTDIKNYDVYEEGKKIRYSERFKEKGTNVNFIEWKENYLFVRTYERGVENETLSCGTGVTASALVAASKGLAGDGHCDIKTKGGYLKVLFSKKKDDSFTDIWLEGPAEFVFKGTIDFEQ
jgi:diaminopimelate epimerase